MSDLTYCQLSGGDRLLEEVLPSGGRIVKPGQRADWGGYSGYFADTDSLLVAWLAIHAVFVLSPVDEIFLLAVGEGYKIRTNSKDR